MAHPGGRPTKYNDEMAEKAEWYVSGGYEELGDVVPSIAGLACHLDIHKQTVNEWADKHPQFSTYVKKVAQVQEKVCVSGGMTGKYNSSITKLLLSKHGYSEKQQIDHTSSDESMKPTTIIIESAKMEDDE